MELTPVSLPHYLTVAALLIAFGVYAVIARRNMLQLAMGIGLIVIAANLAFVAFTCTTSNVTAQFMTGLAVPIVITITALAQGAVAVSLVLLLHRRYGATTAGEVASERD